VLLEDLLEVFGGIGAFGVVPDPDVRDHRGVLGLTHVGGAGQEGEGLAVGPHVEALEEDVAEGVVPGEVVHRLLAEHEQAVEILPDEFGGNSGPPSRQFLMREMQTRSSSLVSALGPEPVVAVFLFTKP
jgi:hypothetical protein